MPFAQFVITNAGNAAAMSASPTGPFVNISEYRIGSGYNYTPLLTDTALHGTTVYTGTPKSYHLIDAQTISINIEVPAEAGPFDYGEIGLYSPGGVLYALATFQELRHKLSVLTDNVPHVLRFHGLLRYAQAPAIFQVNTTNQNNVLEVPDFSYIAAPVTMPSQPNVVIVHEDSSCGDSVMLYKEADYRWTPVKYTVVGEVAIGSMTTTTVTSAYFTSMMTTTSGRYLIQFDEGNVRSVQSITGSVATLTHPVVVSAGADCTLYEAECVRDTVDSDEVSFMWNTFNTIWAAPNPTNGPTYGWGQTAIPLPAGSTPSASEWNQLTGALNTALANLSITTPFAINNMTSRMVPDRTRKVIKLHSIHEFIAQVHRYRLSATPSDMLFDIPISASVTSPWEQHRMSVSAQFTTEANAEAFFNQGGYIGFRARSDRTDYRNSIVQRALEHLGVVAFRADQTSSLGPLNLTYKYGDGIVTDSGPSGYFGLVGSSRKVFSYILPLNGSNLSGRLDECLIVEMYAHKYSSSTLVFDFWVTATTHDNIGGEVLTPSTSAITNPGDPAVNSGTPRIQMNESLYSTYLTGWGSSGTRLDCYTYVGYSRYLPLNYKPTFTNNPATNWGTVSTTPISAPSVNVGGPGGGDAGALTQN